MSVQTVDRAIAVLNILNASTREMSLTEISHRLDLHKSTVHRLLASLEKGGLVDRPPGSRKYRLGIRLIELGNTVLHARELPKIVLPYLHYLSDTVEEIAYLALRENGEVLKIVQVPSPHLVESVLWTGRAPLHCTSTGKIFLAYLSEDELEPLLNSGLPRVTESTITDPVELRSELEQVRKQGFATAFGEHEDHVNAIAVPVMNSDQKVIAAIGLVGPSHRFTPEKVMRFPSVIQGAAREASQRLRSIPPKLI